MLGRITAFIYGASCYALSLVTFAYMFCFIGNFWLSKSIDSGTQTPFVRALAINILLIGVFGLQHTVMARPGFKVDADRAEFHGAEHVSVVQLRGGIADVLEMAAHGRNDLEC
jgi:hypothetical protein